MVTARARTNEVGNHFPDDILGNSHAIPLNATKKNPWHVYITYQGMCMVSDLLGGHFDLIARKILEKDIPITTRCKFGRSNATRSVICKGVEYRSNAYSLYENKHVDYGE